MLTKEILNNLEPGQTIATGVFQDNPLGMNMMGTGEELRWVAVRGRGIPDWTIYCHWAKHPVAYVKRSGDKVHGETNIKRCVPCNDEAFKMYRY